LVVAEFLAYVEEENLRAELPAHQSLPAEQARSSSVVPASVIPWKDASRRRSHHRQAEALWQEP
jgi:hypothetical protein